MAVRKSCSSCIVLSGLMSRVKSAEVAIRPALVAEFHQGGGYRPAAEARK